MHNCNYLIGAAKMEQKTVRWIANVIGYPETSGGSIMSGGTMANLMATMTAREAMDLKSHDYRRYG